jgi:hypothetical protein
MDERIDKTNAAIERLEDLLDQVFTPDTIESISVIQELSEDDVEHGVHLLTQSATRELKSGVPLKEAIFNAYHELQEKGGRYALDSDVMPLYEMLVSMGLETPKIEEQPPIVAELVQPEEWYLLAPGLQELVDSFPSSKEANEFGRTHQDKFPVPSFVARDREYVKHFDQFKEGEQQLQQPRSH